MKDHGLINNYNTSDQSSYIAQANHLWNITDPRISQLFSGTINYYWTVFKGRVRLTTSNYCRNKQADDSSIVYRTGNDIHFSRIHRMFTINDGDSLFQVFTLASSTHFIYETANEQYDYNEIEMGMISGGTTTCIFNVKQIIEKCVFYLQPNAYATFVRLPNLVKSS
ncbi:unnamed protein product [Rotaria socialis]|uniref:Uncharacterized protein n=1 Tax=Rotaria socialis TaxID=392032 RepID=A0A821P5S9_9BILA|nr:unnamed protein product [Rotaria socialis]